MHWMICNILRLFPKQHFMGILKMDIMRILKSIHNLSEQSKVHYFVQVQQTLMCLLLVLTILRNFVIIRKLQFLHRLSQKYPFFTHGGPAHFNIVRHWFWRWRDYGITCSPMFDWLSLLRLTLLAHISKRMSCFHPCLTILVEWTWLYWQKMKVN